jgi:hypothetical protein
MLMRCVRRAEVQCAYARRVTVHPPHRHTLRLPWRLLLRLQGNMVDRGCAPEDVIKAPEVGVQAVLLSRALEAAVGFGCARRCI